MRGFNPSQKKNHFIIAIPVGLSVTFLALVILVWGVRVAGRFGCGSLWVRDMERLSCGCPRPLPHLTAVTTR